MMKLFVGDLIAAGASVLLFFVIGPRARSLGSARSPSAIVISRRGALR